MRFLDALLGIKFKTRKEEKPSEDEEVSKFMPQAEKPIDEKFIVNFKNNGGKFLYCTDETDLKQTFQRILKENHWGKQVCCFEKCLKEEFKNFELNFTKGLEADFCFITCEFLVANSGSLLLSSKQIGEKRLAHLPYNFVVVGKTSQIVDTPSDGLRIINSRKEHLPTNITTIKNFNKNTDQEGHFMNYGSISKNLYLLLLEDL